MYLHTLEFWCHSILNLWLHLSRNRTCRHSRCLFLHGGEIIPKRSLLRRFKKTRNWFDISSLEYTLFLSNQLCRPSSDYCLTFPWLIWIFIWYFKIYTFSRRISDCAIKFRKRAIDFRKCVNEFRTIYQWNHKLVVRNSLTHYQFNGTFPKFNRTVRNLLGKGVVYVYYITRMYWC